MSNLVKRTLFGAIYLGVVIAGALLHPLAFVGVSLFALCAMMVEFHRMTVGTDFALTRNLSILTAAVLFLITFLIIAFDASSKFLALALLPLFAMFASTLPALGHDNFDRITGAYASLVYIALPFCVFNITEFCCDGLRNGMLLLAFFAIVIMSDIGAYILGCLFGKNGPKLYPKISPKKSWMGVFGGFLFGMGTAVALKYIPGFMPAELSLIHCLGLGFVLVLSGIIGDLAESVWKRNAGVKDSGNLIPGHGGMLDRLDSALIAVPMGTIYMIVTDLI